MVIVAGALIGGFSPFAVQGVAARPRAPAVGEEELLGCEGDVRSRSQPVGQVFVRGALWRARAPSRRRRPISVG